MIYLNFTNSMDAVQGDIDQAAVVKAFVTKYPGFPGYIYQNPDQPSNTNMGMGYPYDIYGPNWKLAAQACSPGVLIPRIGGCATHDLPATDGPIDTMCKRFRPSPMIICDWASAEGGKTESDRYQRVIKANNQIFCTEANNKQPYIVPGPKAGVAAQWWWWDLQFPGAESGYKPWRHWGVKELIAAGATPVIEVINVERSGLGYENGVADWPATKVAIAKAFHAIDKRVIVSVRPSGMSAAQVAELRALN